MLPASKDLPGLPMSGPGPPGVYSTFIQLEGAMRFLGIKLFLSARRPPRWQLALFGESQRRRYACINETLALMLTIAEKPPHRELVTIEGGLSIFGSRLIGAGSP